MKPLLLALGLLAPWLLPAQTDPPLVASGSYGNDFYQWSFTVGDLAILTFQTPANYWSQGSQQPVVTIVATHEAARPDVQVTLFPNPTASAVFCTVQTAKPAEKIRFEIRSETGQVVRPWSTEFDSGQVFEIALDGLPAGVFTLEFVDARGGHVAKKIIKN